MLLLESTYGDRVHEPDDQGARLAAIIKDTVARGGKLIIPAFAIGRVEEVLYWIKKLEDEGAIPKLPVFRGQSRWRSMRCAITRIARTSWTKTFSSADEIRRFFTARFQPVSSAQQSSELVRSKIPSIVVSSSGMATGGRVLYHLLGGAARQAQYRAVRGLPGRRHARAAAGGRRARGEDSRADRAGECANREDRFDVGPRRFAGNAAVAGRASRRRRA